MSTSTHLGSYLTHFFLEWEMFQTKVVEKIKTHILCPVTFFRKSTRLWDNVEKNIVRWGRIQTIIWCMRIACWIPKATNPHSEYVILIAFQVPQWVHERVSVLRYDTVHVLFQNFIDSSGRCVKMRCPLGTKTSTVLPTPIFTKVANARQLCVHISFPIYTFNQTGQ